MRARGDSIYSALWLRSQLFSLVLLLLPLLLLHAHEMVLLSISDVLDLLENIGLIFHLDVVGVNQMPIT
jgi:hypothetical protein